MRTNHGDPIAARGVVLEIVLRTALRHPYFRLKPPRSAGREQFGREYAAEFLVSCRRISRRPEDAIATATDARLEHAIAALARACVLEVLADDEASEARDDAERQLVSLGIAGTGWRRVFELALEGVPAGT